MDKEIKRDFKKAKTISQKCRVIRKHILGLDKRIDRLERHLK